MLLLDSLSLRNVILVFSQILGAEIRVDSRWQDRQTVTPGRAIALAASAHPAQGCVMAGVKACSCGQGHHWVSLPPLLAFASSLKGLYPQSSAQPSLLTSHTDPLLCQSRGSRQMLVASWTLSRVVPQAPHLGTSKRRVVICTCSM